MPSLTPEQKASLGSMLGAFTGDALGSFLEFTKGAVKSKTVAKAMTMPGGGFWYTKPG